MAKQLFLNPFDTEAGTIQRGSLSPAALSGSYADLLVPSGNYSVLNISNMTDGYVDISLDGGTNVFWTIPSGGKEELRAPAGQHIPSSVVVKARDGSVGNAPATGTLFVVAMAVLFMLTLQFEAHAQPGAAPVKAVPYDSSLAEKATAGNPFRVDPTGTTPQPVTQSGAWGLTCNAGTNLNTSALALESGGNLATVATQVTSLNSKVTAVNTGAVTVASSALPAGAATSAKQPAFGVAGTASSDVITVQGIASMTPLLVNGSGVTQPVSGTLTCNAGTNLNTSALALESGGNLATIAAKDFATQTTLAALNAKVTAVNTGAVVVSSSALPTGAATETTLSALNTKIPAQGQAAMAASVPVVIANNQSNVPTNIAQMNGTTVSMNTGVRDAGTQRVTIATNDVVPASQSGTWNVGTVTNITNQGQIVDNAVFTDGTTRLNMGGFILDEVAGTALTENDGAAARIDSKRAQILVLEDSTNRGRRATITTGGALLTDGSATTQPVSGTVTANQGGTWSINNVSGIISLPTGAATSANQTTANSSLSSIDGKITACNTGAVIISAQPHPDGMATITTGSTNVTTAGTRVVLGASLTVKKCDIVAKETNTGVIWLGGATVANGNGIPLVSLQRYTMEVSNRNLINLDSTVSGEGVTWSCYS